jgi:lysyl-tRNA synthetase, class II
MLEEIIKERKAKLERYRAVENPYPVTTKRDLTLAEVDASFQKLETKKKSISVVGRVRAWRDQGKITFADIEDETGSFQLVLDGEHVSNFSFINKTVDIGDFVEAKGSPYKTKRGEKSLFISAIRILSKTLQPIPKEWFGLEDTEIRLRKRYLDLLTHKDLRELFKQKAVFWSTVREELKKEEFLEVETPVLEAIPGGADAEPFVTHHKMLDRDFYLRISLELPLKKLLVGGFEKIFEIGRAFRNEGIDREHLQEFTEMECYWAYADHEDMMKFVEKLFKKTIEKTFGKLETVSQGNVLHWGNPWPQIDYFDIFKKETGIDLEKVSTEELSKKAVELGLKPEPGFGRGKLIDLIYKKLVRPKLIQPLFLVGHPIEVSPLAKQDPKNPKRVLRFQVLAGGSELGNGWAEVNDPAYQRARFEEQMKLRAAGDAEAQRMDEDFLEALEYGMPPAAGFGMSERLFAILVDKPIRETTLFPLMKEEKKK